MVESELNIDELRHIIDVSTHDFKTDEEFMATFHSLEARLKNKDSPTFSYKPLTLSKGLEYTKEYPDIALKLNRHIVFHRK